MKYKATSTTDGNSELEFSYIDACVVAEDLYNYYEEYVSSSITDMLCQKRTF